KRSRWLRALAVAAFPAAILTVPLVGLPEYAATTTRLHCRALGFLGSTPPPDCPKVEIERGRQTALGTGPLYTPRERVAVDGFAGLLVLGAEVAGFPEVAWETWRLGRGADVMTDSSTATRHKQCFAGAAVGTEARQDGDFPMRSARIRQSIGGLVDVMKA